MTSVSDLDGRPPAGPTSASSGRGPSADATPPPVDTRGLPPGPRWPAFAAERGPAALPAPVRAVAAPAVRRRLHRPASPGGRPLVLFTRPEHAKEIFAGDPAVFHAGKGNAILGPIMGEHSLLLQDGGEHQRARKLLMPAFNGHALRDYEGLVTGSPGAEVGHWRAGETFRGAGPDERADPRGDPPRRLRRHRRAPARRAPAAGQPRPSTSARPSSSAGASRRCGGSARGVGRSTTPTSSTGSSTPRSASVVRLPTWHDRTDVLSRLIRVADGADALSDVELRDQLVTLLLAGHETTATALAWALYELGRDPRAARPGSSSGRRRRRRLAGGGAQGVDAAAPGHPDGGPHADGAGHHRRHRPAGGDDRRAVDPARPRRARRTTRTPTVSDPERFVGRNPPPNTWIPFGGGVRRCIGAGFSLMEGVAVLREVLTAYDVETVGADHPQGPQHHQRPAPRGADPRAPHADRACVSMRRLRGTMALVNVA